MRKSVQILLTLASVLLVALLGAHPAAAHGAGESGPWQHWSWSELPLLLLLGLAYFIGLRSLWKRAGAGAGISRGRVVAFGAGLIGLFIALVSPLDSLAGQLLTAHMLQHLLLVLVAAPLFVIGRFPLALTWSLPPGWTVKIWKQWRGKQVWNFLTRPAAASLMHAAAIWTWHMPRLYQASLRSEWIHFLEHFSFFITAFLFWHVFVDLTQTLHDRSSAQLGTGIFIVFLTAMANGLLGVLIAFSPYVWYPVYIHEASLLGLTALEDQQLAGTIMWVPGGIVYTASALSMIGRWLFAMESLENPGS